MNSVPEKAQMNRFVYNESALLVLLAMNRRPGTTITNLNSWWPPTQCDAFTLKGGLKDKKPQAFFSACQRRGDI